MSRQVTNASQPAFLDTLLELGFDRSTELEDEPGRYRVRCSQCEALVIQGTATHERGCPNRTHECAECAAVISNRAHLCDSCANPVPDEDLCDERRDDTLFPDLSAQEVA